jgi:collagenase-like PrtC family protease
MEEPTSLNVLEILPEIARIGVAAIKVEGRQRSPTYVAQVTRNLRAALDELPAAPEKLPRQAGLAGRTGARSPKAQVTLGAYNRPWR